MITQKWTKLVASQAYFDKKHYLFEFDIFTANWGLIKQSKNALLQATPGKQIEPWYHLLRSPQ